MRTCQTLILRVTSSAIDKMFEIFGPIFEQNSTMIFETIFEQNANFGPIFEKHAYFGPIFEKKVNFKHFVNGKWTHYYIGQCFTTSPEA